MKKVFVSLTREELSEINPKFFEIDQENWVLEESDDEILLCGYFEGDHLPSWENLKRSLPVLSTKSLCIEEIKSSDWENEYKKFLKPIIVAPIHIVPLWEKENYKIAPGEVGIYLDAGVAFGTGAHETTQLCLERLVKFWKQCTKIQGTSIIDVGCGSGILSIAAAKLGFNDIDGFDLDPDAIKVSRENAEINGILSIRWKVSDIAQGINSRCADFIMANILAPVLIANASILVEAVNCGGVLSLSGILTTELEKVHEKFSSEIKKVWGNFEFDTSLKGQWSEIAYKRM